MGEERLPRLTRIFPSRSCRSTKLNLDQHAGGRFDKVFDSFEESDGFAAIDDAMIVSESDVHHGPDDNVARASNRTLLNRMKAQHAALGRVNDGCREQGAVNTTVADSKCAALQLFDF